MRTMRKLAAAVVAAVLLAACGGGGDGGGDATQPTTITVWAMGAEGEKLGTLPTSSPSRTPTSP